MITKLMLVVSALGGAFLTFTLTGPAHAEFMCYALQCEENPNLLYPDGVVCWASSGKKSIVKIADLRACVEGVTQRTAVMMHVVAQGASGRSAATWNGGRAVTLYALGAQPLFPESGGYLYYEVGVKPADLVVDGGWLLERPDNGSYVATTVTPTGDSLIVLAGGGGSRGRIGKYTANEGTTWTPTSAIGGRGGRAIGWNFTPDPYEGYDGHVIFSGDAGGGHGSAGGGSGAYCLGGGAAGAYGTSRKSEGVRIPSESGWGELYGPAAYGAYNGRHKYRMVGGEGGQGDGGGGGGGVYDDCGTFKCESNEVYAAAGGGGGSRAKVTKIEKFIPVFERAARIEFVFTFDPL